MNDITWDYFPRILLKYVLDEVGKYAPVSHLTNAQRPVKEFASGTPPGKPRHVCKTFG
jgi:hypothetical protein